MKRLFFICCSMAFASASYSQTVSDSLLRRDFLLERDYVPVTETAERVYHDPSIEPVQTKKSEIRFDTEKRSLSLFSEYVPLTVAEAKTNYPYADQLGYVRLGGGNHYRFLGDAQLNLIRGEQHYLDATIWHRSQAAPLLTDGKNRWDADNHFQLAYNYHWGGSELKASLSERLYRWNYYAPVSNAVPQQISSDACLRVGIQSKPWNHPFDYQVGVEAHHFSLAKPIDSMSALPLPKEWELSLTARTSYRFNQDWTAHLAMNMKHFSGNTLPFFWYELHPSVQYVHRLWTFSLGGKLSWSNQTGLKPALTASVLRNLGTSAAFALEIDGGEQVFSYREHFEQNRYIDPSIRLEPEYVPIRLRTHLDWKLFHSVVVTPVAGVEWLKNTAVFSNVTDGTMHPELAGYFSADYVDAVHFFMGSDVAFSLSNSIQLRGDFRYHHYQVYQSQHAWLTSQQGAPSLNYRPKMESAIGLETRPFDRFLLSATYRWLGHRFAPTLENVFTRLPDVHDLSATASYSLNARFSVFVQMRNVLNQSYAIWYAYPVNQLTGVIGASYSF